MSAGKATWPTLAIFIVLCFGAARAPHGIECTRPDEERIDALGRCHGQAAMQNCTLFDYTPAAVSS